MRGEYERKQSVVAPARGRDRHTGLARPRRCALRDPPHLAEIRQMLTWSDLSWTMLNLRTPLDSAASESASSPPLYGLKQNRPMNCHDLYVWSVCQPVCRPEAGPGAWITTIVSSSNALTRFCNILNETGRQNNGLSPSQRCAFPLNADVPTPHCCA